MKKSLIALAVLGAFAGTAMAQSSVTVFGVVDLSLRSVKDGTVSQKQMAKDGNASSRLGFRGTEDLGGGMSVGFWLEGSLDPDTGTAGGQKWTRRSTASMMGGFGEVRLGRDYTPTFWNTTVFDPFGTNGVGAFTNVSIQNNNYSGTTAANATPFNTGASTYVRADNSIGYFLPGNLGGLYGQGQISAGEGTNANKQTSIRVGYAAGPLNVAFSTGTTKTAVNYKHDNLAGSFKFGITTLMGQYDTQKAGSDKQVTYLLGAVVALGQGQLKASYASANQSGAAIDANDATQLAVGYVHDLSKRTSLYGTYSSISNKGAATFQVGGVNGSLGTAAGTKSTGYEVGIRHSF